MVLAVNWPPQAPGPGQAEASTSSSWASLILSGGVGSDGFEDLLDGDVDFFGGTGLGGLAVGADVEVAGSDGAAVEHEAGDVETRQGHDGGGHVFVAAGDADDAVEGVAASYEFDAVGDDFAGDERGLHAFGAHGDAVGDGDGVELHGGAAGFADALLDGFGDVAEMEVAGADLGPGVGDADDGLVEIFLGEADAAEHGAGCGAGGAFGEDVAVGLAGVVAQCNSPSGAVVAERRTGGSGFFAVLRMTTGKAGASAKARSRSSACGEG